MSHQYCNEMVTNGIELGTEITGDYGNTSTIYNSIRGADLIVTTVCILPTPVVANADC